MKALNSIDLAAQTIILGIGSLCVPAFLAGFYYFIIPGSFQGARKLTRTAV